MCMCMYVSYHRMTLFEQYPMSPHAVSPLLQVATTPAANANANANGTVTISNTRTNVNGNGNGRRGRRIPSSVGGIPSSSTIAEGLERARLHEEATYRRIVREQRAKHEVLSPITITIVIIIS